MYPKISIIFPVYNTSNYLEQAINSVLAQTYDHWELITINDASTDGSLPILKGFAKKDPRVNLIDLKENQGLGRVRNIAMEHATGKYLVFLDSDDFLAPDALTLLHDQILKKPNNDAFVWGFSSCTSKGKVLKMHLPQKPDKPKVETAFKMGMLGRKGFATYAWVYAVKRTFVEQNQLRFAEGMYFEDVQFSTQLLYFAEKVGVIAHSCYFYRKHGASITGRSSKQKIDDKFTAFTQIRPFLKEQGAFEQYQEFYLVRFLALCVHTSFNEYFGLFRKERDKELDAYMLSIRKSSLLQDKNLQLLRNLGLSLPKTEKDARNAYLGAYHGLKGIRDNYKIHRFVLRTLIQFNRFRNNIFNE